MESPRSPPVAPFLLETPASPACANKLDNSVPQLGYRTHLKNAQTYALHNCFVFGSYVTLPFTYLSLSGNDKCIPHALDAFSSDILIQDLSIARRFAALAAHICYNKSPDIARLYCTHVFINQDRLFNTDDLTLLLTLPHLGIKLDVRHWRHVTTAFRGKISTHMHPILHYEEHSTPDLPNGHSRSMANHTYAQARPRGCGPSPLSLNPQSHTPCTKR